MTVKSLRKQLAAAIAMTLVATVALGSSTYAWFAINSKVTATGMSFKTSVSDNLFIVEDTLASTEKKNDSLFGTAIVQTISNALLEPVSTVNGTDYFYSSVTNVLGNGDTKLDTWNTYNNAETTAFNSNYSTEGAVGYVDYVYQLKAVNGGDNAAYVKLDQLSLTYNDASDPQKAYRAAVFVEDITSANPAGGVGTLQAIYRVSGAQYFGVLDNGAYDNANKAVSSTSGLANVTNIDKATSMEVAAHKTKYYKVVVRLWLEGEDTTCNNTTFADLNKGKWALSCDWVLNNTPFAAEATMNITEVAGVVDLTAGGVALGSNTVTINGQVYTEITGATLDSKKLYVMGTAAISNTSRVFQILDATGADGTLYPYEVTHRCTLPAGQ